MSDAHRERASLKDFAWDIPQTFFLTITNPGAVLGLFAIFGGVSTFVEVKSNIDALTMVAAIMGGILSLWILLSEFIGRIRHKEGRDLTIVTYSATAHESLAVANELVSDGWEVEVVDLRSVKPLDTDTVMASVARTGRLLCVGESWPCGGVTAEVIARVTAEGFDLLDVPPQRLNAKDTPVPYHPNLWAAHRPTARTIGDAARKMLNT